MLRLRLRGYLLRGRKQERNRMGGMLIINKRVAILLSHFYYLCWRNLNTNHYEEYLENNNDKNRVL